MSSQSSSNYSRLSGNVGFDSGAGADGSVSGRSIYKPISQSRGSFKDYQKKVAGAGGAGTSGSVGQMGLAQNTGLAFLTASSGSVHSGVDSVKKGRAQEKKDLQELNERFASYIEKARFLEAQNKSLAAEIEFLKGGSTSDNSKIKEMYEIELNQLRKLLNEAEKAKGPLELKIHSLETELDDLLIRMKVLENSNSEYKLTIDRQRKDIMGLESELVQLRRFRSTNEEDSSRYKDEISYMKDDLKKVKQDFEREALARINLEHDLQSLQETLEFERQVNETEIKNLSGVAYRDTTKENQVFWQNEMGRALRDIQGEYENKLVAMKQEIEANYGLQLQEIRTSKTRENVETTHLREENVRTKSNIQNMKTRMSELEMKVSEYEFMINQLRGELEEAQRASELQRLMLQEELTTTKSNLTHSLAELQSILDAKLGLELEICAYRKLLEFEETRLNTAEDTDPVVSQFVNLTIGCGSSGGGGAAVSNRSGMSTGGGVLNGSVSSASISLGGDVTTGGGASVGANLSIGGGLKLGGDSDGTNSEREKVSEIESQKIKFRRTTKGNISIAEIDIEGTNIILENIGSSVEHLGGMVIKRSIDGTEDAITYVIPVNVSLKPNQKLRICAYGTKTGHGKELEIDEESWGVGENIKTTLFDVEGEIKAQHIQEFVR